MRCRGCRRGGRTGGSITIWFGASLIRCLHSLKLFVPSFVRSLIKSTNCCLRLFSGLHHQKHSPVFTLLCSSIFPSQSDFQMNYPAEGHSGVKAALSLFSCRHPSCCPVKHLVSGNSSCVPVQHFQTCRREADVGGAVLTCQHEH